MTPEMIWGILSNKILRPVAVDQAISDATLARQSVVEAASETALGTKGRSTGGRARQRGGNVKRRRS